jgi:hypothetical protein
MSRLRRRRNAANASKNTSTMVFTIAVRLPHNTFRPNFDSNSLALFDCCMGSKEKKRTSVLGLYEATDILLLLTHATIYRFDATLNSKSTMTATPTASDVRSILQTNCTVKRWRGGSKRWRGGSKSSGKAKTQNNYLSHH